MTQRQPAAEFGGVEPKIVAQHVEQWRVQIGRHAVHRAVHRETDNHDRRAPLEAMNACCFRFGATVEARRAMKQFHARLEEGWREPYAYIAPLPR